MARIRTVKPELFGHEELFDAERETGLPLRLAFIGLFTCCDRDGRFKWRPRTLKKDVLPHDEIDFSRVLDALSTRGFIRKYALSGEEYGVIPSWAKHQVINNRESASDIPAPTEQSYETMTSTRGARVDDASGTRCRDEKEEGKGKEGKGREGKEQLPDAGAPAVAIERRKENLEAIEDQLDAALPVVAPTQEHQAGVVFEHWKLVMDSPRSAFDDKRKGFIKKALKLGYSVEDLCAAIDGCRKSPHHMGQNDRGLKYNTIDLIFRSADFIDKFMVIGRSPRVPSPPSRLGAVPSNFHGINDQNYSSSAAAAARTQAQWGIDGTDGNLDI